MQGLHKRSSGCVRPGKARKYSRFDADLHGFGPTRKRIEALFASRVCVVGVARCRNGHFDVFHVKQETRRLTTRMPTHRVIVNRGADDRTMRDGKCRSARLISSGVA